MADTPLTMDNHRNVEFILSLANWQRSIENGIVKAGQGVLKAGTIVQWDTVAPTKFVKQSGAIATDGSLVTESAGVIMYTVDATSVDQPVAYVRRDAELKDYLLIYPPESSAGGEKLATMASNRKDYLKCHSN
jgi:hypothetical protein